MRPSSCRKVITLGWHFPSGRLTNYGTLLDIISWMNQIIWGWKILPLQNLLFVWLQDKQHVAQYLGKFYLIHMKRISYSDNSLNIYYFCVKSKQKKNEPFKLSAHYRRVQCICFGSGTWNMGQKRLKFYFLYGSTYWQ